MADTIDVNGITADDVYNTIRTAGVSDVDAKLLVSNWIYQNYLTEQRTFSYVTQFPASVPACVPAPFTRTFVHRDWVDGEDLVQAAESATDDGFNTRFHQIEADLDSLGAQVATVAQCMADMRQSLRSMLDEIAAELNRIDEDLGTLRGSPVWKPPGLTGLSATEFTGAGALASQLPTARIVSGITGDPMVNYLGSTVFQEKTVSLFNTSQGIVMMPAVDVSTPTAVDTRVGAAGAVWQATVDNADLNHATQQAVNKDDLVANFGDLTLSNGQTLRQALAVLPNGAHYDNLQDMITDLSARTAGALQSTTGLASQIAASVNAPADATTLSSVDLGGVKELPPDATAALRKAGITTIGQLAGTPAATLTKTLQGAGVNMTAGEVAAMQGTAQTLAQMSTK